MPATSSNIKFKDETSSFHKLRWKAILGIQCLHKTSQLTCAPGNFTASNISKLCWEEKPGNKFGLVSEWFGFCQIFS